MSNVSFVQVNARNVNDVLTAIETAKNPVGFEVIEKKVIEKLDINIDPQHTGVKNYDNISQPENTSASLFVLGLLPTIDPKYNDLIVLPSKLDIDSVAAATLWYYADFLSQMENDEKVHDKFIAMCDRVKEIDKIDCGLGNSGVEWNPEYHKSQLIRDVSDFNVLGSMCSDFKLPIADKIGIMLEWLVEGELPQNYVNQVTQELNAQKESAVTVVNCNGVLVRCVTSEARGATGLLYSSSPFGVCYNPEFPVKDGTVKKYTICEFTAGKYLDLPSILAELNEIESGWGGNLNAGIIGSPFGGTSLTPDTVCEIVSRHVK